MERRFTSISVKKKKKTQRKPTRTKKWKLKIGNKTLEAKKWKLKSED